MPELSRCALCGRSLEGGGAVLGEEQAACGACAVREEVRGEPSLGRAALAFLRDAERRHLQEFAAAPPDPAAVREAGAALRRLLVRYLGREPRALSFLEKLEVLP
jgi:recombinational DNA repair protein (RecF pathway)